MNEDQYIAREQDDEDARRKERDRTDAIIDARHDLITEARTLRRHTQYTLDWFRSLDELRDITDRLNELEGDTA